jgi:pseudaminic acid biosynthesis-associated methylase
MPTETDRLEKLWGDNFGDEYTVRNSDGFFLRKDFWTKIGTTYKPETVCEIGCNVGNNLKYLGSAAKAECYGLDINKSALRKARISIPGLNLVYGKARDLPFKNGLFDLSFTCGVLIHQPQDSLRQVMSEVVRISKKYVLCMEYFRDKRTVIPYRQQKGALFGDDYGGIYQREFGLKLLETGVLKKDQGFDNVTYWVMEK